jgi:hypothetical protein
VCQQSDAFILVRCGEIAEAQCLGFPSTPLQEEAQQPGQGLESQWLVRICCYCFTETLFDKLLPR